MKMKDIPFTITEWDQIDPVEYKGETGTSFWRIFEKSNVRVRMVDYSPGFRLDHYCSRGHILLVLEGTISIQLKDGQTFELKSGSSFQVGDDIKNPHLAYTKNGAKVFIVD